MRIVIGDPPERHRGPDLPTSFVYPPRETRSPHPSVVDGRTDKYNVAIDDHAPYTTAPTRLHAYVSRCPMETNCQ